MWLKPTRCGWVEGVFRVRLRFRVRFRGSVFRDIYAVVTGDASYPFT